MSIISYIFLFCSIRKKFFNFINLVLLFSIWGFLFNMDGMMLVFLLTEFTIVLLFFMTYMQLYSNFNFITKNYNKILIFLLILFCIFTNNNQVTISYTSYYKSLFHIVSSDFFILYYILFINAKILVIFVTIILTFFSLFFILLYFYLKKIKNSETTSAKNLFFLRKQALIKQNSFISNLSSFQR